MLGLILIGTTVALISFISGAWVMKSHERELAQRQLREYLDPTLDLATQLQADGVAARGGKEWTKRYSELLETLLRIKTIIDREVEGA